MSTILVICWTKLLTRIVQRENIGTVYIREKESHREPNRELRYNTDTYKNSPEGKSVGNSSGVESLYSDILLSLKIKIHKCLLFGIINTIFALVLW